MSACTKSRKDLKQCYEDASKSLLSYMQQDECGVTTTNMSSANESRQLSRQSSLQQAETTSTDDSAAVSRQSSVRHAGGEDSRIKPKLCRRVSFTEKEPVIIPGAKEESTAEGSAEEPKKPRRVKKSHSGDKEKKRKSKRDKSSDPTAVAAAVNGIVPTAERRKSQPLGDELFEQVHKSDHSSVIYEYVRLRSFSF